MPEEITAAVVQLLKALTKLIKTLDEGLRKDLEG